MDHASSRQIVGDYTHLYVGIKRLMPILFNANGSIEY